MTRKTSKAGTKTRKKTVRKATAKPVSKSRRQVGALSEDRPVCNSLGDIRREIDSLDAVIVPLLCKRHYFVTQAAQFKPSVEGVVVRSRVEAIVASVRKAAKKSGVNPDAIEAVYRSMIDAFTKDEQRHWRKINKT